MFVPHNIINGVYFDNVYCTCNVCTYCIATPHSPHYAFQLCAHKRGVGHKTNSKHSLIDYKKLNGKSYCF